MIKNHILALPFSKVDWQHDQIAGTPLEPLLPLWCWKMLRGSRLIADPDGNNVKDWAIRSQASKLVMDESMRKVQRLDGYGF